LIFANAGQQSSELRSFMNSIQNQLELPSSTHSLSSSNEKIENARKLLTKRCSDLQMATEHEIQLVDDMEKEIELMKERNTYLQSRLTVSKLHLEAKQLNKQRLVCNDNSCVQYKIRPNGEKFKHFTTICMDPCYLENARTDTMAHPGFIKLAIFAGDGNCRNCGHAWQRHMHVLYELEEKSVIVVDEDVQEALVRGSKEIEDRAHAITMKRLAISDLEHTWNEIKGALKELE
jgi:hypothetical protein